MRATFCPNSAADYFAAPACKCAQAALLQRLGSLTKMKGMISHSRIKPQSQQIHLRAAWTVSHPVGLRTDNLPEEESSEHPTLMVSPPVCMRYARSAEFSLEAYNARASRTLFPFGLSGASAGAIAEMMQNDLRLTFLDCNVAHTE
jgi:hypothetical protein